MSRTSADDGSILELTCHFRDLHITIAGPPDRATEALQVLSRHFASGSSQPPTGAISESSFDLLSEAASVAAPPRGLGLETRDQIAATFPPCPDQYLRLGASLSGSRLGGVERIKRAWLAGNWAKAVLDSRVASPCRTPQLDIRPRVYAILRSERTSQPTLCKSAGTYWSLVGSLEESNSISHAFPSESEAKIYFAGASAPSYVSVQ